VPAALVLSGATKKAGPGVTGTTTLTSDAFDPTPNQLLVAIASFTQYTDNTDRAFSVSDTATGTDTWTLLKSVTWNTIGGTGRGLLGIWGARTGASPGSARTITITRDAGTVDCVWNATFLQAHNVASSFPGTLLGSASDPGDTTSTTVNPSISPAPLGSSAVLASYRIDEAPSSGPTITHPAGWTLIVNDASTWDSVHRVACVAHDSLTAPVATATFAQFGFSGVLVEFPEAAPPSFTPSGAIQVIL
jgi:hypothetical protein